MPDSNKFSEWMELGILIGGGLLATLGIKRARRSADDDDRELERDRRSDSERERIRKLEEERTVLLAANTEGRIMAEIRAMESRISEEHRDGLSNNKKIFFDTFAEYHNKREDHDARLEKKLDDIDGCVRRIEQDIPVMRGDIDRVENDIEELKRRRPAR